MAVTNSGMTLFINNDNDTNWTGEDGTSAEVYWQGTGSQKWIVSKTATETAVLTLSGDLSAAKYFTFGMLSTIAPFYNTIKLQMESTTNNYEEFVLSDRSQAAPLYRAIAGEFAPSAVSLEFGQGTTTGTYARASHTILRITVDNSTSGNIRSVENHYMDAMYYGDGRTISGTTTTDKLFKESNDLNISGDVLDCCTMEFGGEIFGQTDLLITTTTGNSYAETLVYREVPNTSNSYTLEITGTADFQGTTLKGANTNVTVNFDVSAATSFQMLGGVISNAGTTLLKSGQDILGVVFTDRTSIAHNSSTFESNTINTSGLITIGTAGTFDKNTIKKSTSTASVLASDPSIVTNCIFESDGSNHALELDTAGTYSFSGHSFTSYATTDGTTGNEVIYNNSGGHIQLNKSGISDVVTIRNSTGSTTTVVASFDLTLTDIASGVQVTIVNSSTRTELQNSISTGVDIIYTHGGGETVDILLMDLDYDPNLSDIFDLTLPSADSTIKFQMIDDPNFNNPA